MDLTQNTLGEGEFGKVVKGFLTRGNQSIPVAVKMIKGNLARTKSNAVNTSFKEKLSQFRTLNIILIISYNR